MHSQNITQQSPVLFIPHGGGPMPLLGDASHQTLIEFLNVIPASFVKPTAILVISAHWEAKEAIISSSSNPALLYDYYGFPEEAYAIKYPVSGDPALADAVLQLLKKHDITTVLDADRGLDHGVFVPLKIMYPNADIPCVQLSLINNLDPETHIKIGEALTEIRKENVLVLGSGFSFHNLNAFFRRDSDNANAMNAAFEDWLIETCTNPTISTTERKTRLIDWRNAPYADFCHPRAEHLLPLHVCVGLTDSPAKLVFNDKVAGKRTCAFLW